MGQIRHYWLCNRGAGHCVYWRRWSVGVVGGADRGAGECGVGDAVGGGEVGVEEGVESGTEGEEECRCECEGGRGKDGGEG